MTRTLASCRHCFLYQQWVGSSAAGNWCRVSEGHSRSQETRLSRNKWKIGMCFKTAFQATKSGLEPRNCSAWSFVCLLYFENISYGAHFSLGTIFHQLLSTLLHSQTSCNNISGLKSAATREPRAVGRQSLCESRASSGSYVGSAKLKAKYTF